MPNATTPWRLEWLSRSGETHASELRIWTRYCRHIDCWPINAMDSFEGGRSVLPPAIGNRVTASAFGGNREVARTLLQPLGADNTTAYFSFLMQAQGTVGEGAFEGWFAFVLRAGARNVSIGKDSFHNLYKVESDLGDIAFSTVPVVANQTHLIVLRADFLPGDDVFRLYMDPQSGQPEPAIASATMSSFDLGTVTSIGLDGPGAFGFDELRIGTDWNSVTPAPEPAALTLALVGVGCLVAKKWMYLTPSSVRVGLCGRIWTRSG